SIWMKQQRSATVSGRALPWLFFFFQVEDGIRVRIVTGVQTCALPIWRRLRRGEERLRLGKGEAAAVREAGVPAARDLAHQLEMRSEERRVGKECRSRGARDRHNKNIEDISKNNTCPPAP